MLEKKYLNSVNIEGYKDMFFEMICDITIKRRLFLFSHLAIQHIIYEILK